MRLILIILCFLKIDIAIAQENDTIAESDWMYPYQRTRFCLDEIKSFDISMDTLVSFEFQLFDRWGKFVAKAKNPVFKISDCLIEDQEALIRGTYVYLIKLLMPSGEERHLNGHWEYLPEMCE